MCDFSLTHVKSRPARVADRLQVHNFGTGTTGFSDYDEPGVAVCIMPGTEIAFERPFETRHWDGMFSHTRYSKVAIFRQVNKDQPSAHHDALETPDGEIILLTLLREGQHATVLQLPAAPKTVEEAEDQERLPIAG